MTDQPEHEFKHGLLVIEFHSRPDHMGKVVDLLNQVIGWARGMGVEIDAGPLHMGISDQDFGAILPTVESWSGWRLLVEGGTMVLRKGEEVIEVGLTKHGEGSVLGAGVEGQPKEAAAEQEKPWTAEDEQALKDEGQQAETGDDK